MENQKIINEDLNEDLNEELNDNKNKTIFEPKTKNDKLKVDCWHNDKNGDLTPRDVSKKSRKMCWFSAVQSVSTADVS